MSKDPADYLAAATDDERSPAAVLADQHDINEQAAWDRDTFLPERQQDGEVTSAIVRVDDA